MEKYQKFVVREKLIVKKELLVISADQEKNYLIVEIHISIDILALTSKYIKLFL